MRIPERCKQCDGRSLVYATVTGAAFRTHYRKCDSCGRTSKTISMIRTETFLSGRDFQHNVAASDKIAASTFPHTYKG